MKLPESQKDFEQLMKGIKWNRFIPPIVSVMQPVIIGGLWLVACRFDKRADATAKFIAIAESIPTIDLNLPKPVVLASLYHSIDEALDMLKEVIQTLKDIDVPTAEEVIDAGKDAILEPLEPIIEPTKDFLQALGDCQANAKKNLSYAYYTPAGPIWIVSCMAQKGFTITVKQVKDQLGL
ncbi:MAG: hypothetical protein [Circular genetic element sp.]|nr:MAG: hypothetical protein [Circular genetic element sp.]